MSLPLAYSRSKIKKKKPHVLATSRKRSDGFRRVIISTSKNNVWPPSSPGIGMMFMNASIIDKKAVICQKEYQFH